MTKFPLHLILFLIFFGLKTTSLFASSFPQELFFKAGQSYEKGQYEEAEKIYQKILGEDPNGAVYYNLGNTYFRLGDKAKAIFSFRKALRYFPMNGDLHYNLQYLRSDTVDKIQDNRGFTLDKASMKIPLTLEKLFILLAFSAFFFCLLAGIELFKKNEWIKWLKNAAFLLFIFCLPLNMVKYFDNRPFGVVSVSESNVYSGVGKDNVILFTLHEGSEFWISDMRENSWLQIALSDGKKGWIKSKDVISNENFGI